LPHWVLNDVLMYADDTKLWTRMNHFEYSLSLQDDQIKLLELGIDIKICVTVRSRQAQSDSFSTLSSDCIHT
jgi:hypothetical protein